MKSFFQTLEVIIGVILLYIILGLNGVKLFIYLILQLFNVTSGFIIDILVPIFSAIFTFYLFNKFYFKKGKTGTLSKMEVERVRKITIITLIITSLVITTIKIIENI